MVVIRERPLTLSLKSVIEYEYRRSGSAVVLNIVTCVMQLWAQGCYSATVLQALLLGRKKMMIYLVI